MKVVSILFVLVAIASAQFFNPEEEFTSYEFASSEYLPLATSVLNRSNVLENTSRNNLRLWTEDKSEETKDESEEEIGEGFEEKGMSHEVENEEDEIPLAGGSDYRKVGLDLHNKYRRAHGASPLTLQNNMNNIAHKCAQYLATRRIFDPVCKKVFKHNYGENLYMATNGNPTQSIKNAVTMWYNEKKFFNFKNGGFSSNTGHFTQVVWKNSKRLGIGHYANGNFRITVALYDPSGNVRGQFQNNVKRG